MKFTLNEKYILDEAKFVLNERFILTEAVTAEEFKTNLNKLKDLLNSDGYDTTKLNDIKTTDKLTDVKQRADESIKSGDIGKIKGAVQTYVDAFKAAVPDWSSKPNIANAIKGLQEAINSYDIEDIESDNNITTAYQTFSTAASEVLSAGGIEDRTNLKADVAKYENTIKKLDILRTRLNTTASFDELYNKAASSEANLERYNQLVTEVLGKLPKNIIALDLEDNLDTTATSKNLAAIVAPIQKFFAAIANLNKTSGTIDTTDDAIAPIKNWRDRYKACKSKQDFENFWNEYFNSEWGEYSKKAEELGYAFLQELDKLGFDKNNNPFIAYLKTDARIAQFDENKYSVLHNAVVDGTLSINDIAGKGKLGKNNIIFLPDWLTKSAGDMEEYLDVQYRIQNANLDTANTAAYRQNPGEYTLNLMTGNTKTTLIPADDITGELNTRLDSDAVKTSMSDKDIIDGLATVSSVDMAKKYLAIAVPMFHLDNGPAIDKAEEKINGGIYALFSGADYSAEDMSKFTKAFSLDSKELTSKQITLLLLGLAKKVDATKVK